MCQIFTHPLTHSYIISICFTYFKGSSQVSTSSNPREIVVSAMEQANTISSIANSLLQPHIDEDNILKAQVSILLYGYT